MNLEIPPCFAFAVYSALALVSTVPSIGATSLVDTRGPVQNAGMHVLVNEDGVQAPGYIWQKPSPKEKWEAKWIASAGPAIRGSQAVCFRKEIILTQEPKKVTAWITANDYLLYINGHPAARGPSDAGRDFQGFPSGRRFYEVRDLTAHLHRGANAIAAEVFGGNSLIFEARVEYADGKEETIFTDETWRGIASPYLNQTQFAYDPKDQKKLKMIPSFIAETEPIGWLEPGFNDSAWPVCKVTKGCADQLIVSELPPLMEARYPYFTIKNVTGGVSVPANPLTPGNPVLVKGEGSFSVQFDKIMAGRCGILVKGGKGAVIELFSNETDISPGGRVYRLELRDGLQAFESRDYYALGTIRVAVSNATTPVEILEVSADFLSQPVEYRGSFQCSDESLNRLWASGRWSTQICMITHHLDSASHQEPIGDYGDYLIADLVNYTTMGTNFSLSRQDLRKWAWVMEAAKYKTFHTSYIFYWLQALLNYYDYTGDRSVIDELAPNVHAVIDQFTSYIGKNGIISDAPNYMFMDWVTIPDPKDGKKAFGAHHPPAVIGQGYMTALFYRALADGIRVCKLEGDAGRAQKYEELRKKVGAAYEVELWNPSQGQYRDGKPFVTSVKPYTWLPADVDMESFSAQNNSFAVLYGLAPGERRAAIIDRMVQGKVMFPRITPYFMHFVFDAFAAVGRFNEYAPASLKSYKVFPATQTVREMGPDRGDYSHGWIASPTYQMSSKILGITPAKPGFEEISIRPMLCGLSFARGSVPSPFGDILVDWKQEGDHLTLKTTIPAGTRATLSLPIGKSPSPSVSANGKSIQWENGAASADNGITKASRNGEHLDIVLRAGNYEFVVAGFLK